MTFLSFLTVDPGHVTRLLPRFSCCFHLSPETWPGPTSGLFNQPAGWWHLAFLHQGLVPGRPGTWQAEEAWLCRQSTQVIGVKLNSCQTEQSNPLKKGLARVKWVCGHLFWRIQENKAEEPGQKKKARLTLPSDLLHMPTPQCFPGLFPGEAQPNKAPLGPQSPTQNVTAFHPQGSPTPRTTYSLLCCRTLCHSSLFAWGGWDNTMVKNMSFGVRQDFINLFCHLITVILGK